VKKETEKTVKPLELTGRNPSVIADLIAVLVAITNGEPRVLTIQNANALPSGPFEFEHRSLQSGLRMWVEEQTRHPLGYLEQLYTFADRDRAGAKPAQRVISISYLGLTREGPAERAGQAGWCSWYDYFPWEDHRTGIPSALPEAIVPRLKAWANASDDRPTRRDRKQRAAVAFGFDGHVWNEELVLQRYELLYEAALVKEANRGFNAIDTSQAFGHAMKLDHRRILATGIARLRAKIKYRPVVFELLPPIFTLLQLQRSVEALAGRVVHKQNFRRLVEQQDLVEETGAITTDTVGRPAKLFRFRHAVLAERAISEKKLPLAHT
jgi:hypothetical protein